MDTQGRHELNREHFMNLIYSESRVKHAQNNINKLFRALDDGHWNLFERVVENEALTTCAFMLLSEQSRFLPSRKLIE